MLKEPVMLKAKSNACNTSNQSATQPITLHGKVSERNMGCSDGFFKTAEPSRNGGFFQKRYSELTPSEFDTVAKSSIHSLMQKKSPCKRSSEP